MTEKNFFIGHGIQRVSSETLATLKNCGACIVSDAMKGFNSMSSRIHTIVPGQVICGPAVTVRLRPGDNLLLHRAIEMAQPGDIIVVDTGLDCRHAVIGSIMTTAAFSKKKIGGLVIDGAVRDVEDLRKNQYPVFAAGIVPNTGENDGPGMWNRPISCGDVPVLPGDIIVADDNGVAVVPIDFVPLVLENCKRKIAKEEKRIKEIENGQITSQAILDKLTIKGF